MLIELGVVEQRHQAVLEVLGGLCVTEVARRYGVTRQTVHPCTAGCAGTRGPASAVSPTAPRGPPRRTTPSLNVIDAKVLKPSSA